MNQPTLADEEIIVHLIKDFIEGEGSFKKSDKKYSKVKKTRELIRRIQYMELSYGRVVDDIPQTIRDLVNYLKTQPISRYLPLLSQDLDIELQKEFALGRYNQLTPAILELITEDNAHEQIQKHIVALREKIIKSGKEEFYEICRFFFAAENNFETRNNLKRRMTKLKIPASWQDEIIQNFYVSVGNKKLSKEFCPYCGNPLTNEHLETSKVCRHFKQTDFFFKPITKSFDITEEVYCFDEKVVKSIVIPNIGEQRLRNLLLTIPGVIEVVMYPYFDSYDLKVVTKTRTFWIDVKDYQYPRSLAQYFAKEYKQAQKLLRPRQTDIRPEDVFLLIPKHRIEISSDQYLKRLRTNLENRNLSRIKVISEGDFIKLLKKEIKGDY